jgi:hypothetical protein
VIVISEVPGQLCNRIFLNAYAMALAEGSGQKLVDLSLNEYRFLFPATRWKLPQQLHFAFRKFLRLLIKGLHLLPFTRPCFVRVGALVTADHSVTHPEFIAGIKARRFTFIEGFPDPSKIVLLSTDPIRAKFTPDHNVLEMVRKHVSAARTGVDVLIGLHIRRGDYVHFFGGKYNYSTSFYQQVMETMGSFFSGRRVAFLLCTNGPKEFADNLPYKIISGPGMEQGALGDLHCLAECDYIIGPPSSFSLWAAFYGRKPIVHLFEQRLPAGVADFVIPDRTFECADGKFSLEERGRLQNLNNEFYGKHKRIKRLYDNIHIPIR